MGFRQGEELLEAAADWTVYTRAAEFRESLKPKSRGRKPPRTPEELQAERLRRHEEYEGLRRKLDAMTAARGEAGAVAGVTTDGR